MSVISHRVVYYAPIRRAYAHSYCLAKGIPKPLTRPFFVLCTQLSVSAVGC